MLAHIYSVFDLLIFIPLSSKKAFASSAFYRPDHPTIDDQVELAQRISFSLVDENNKMSRGQSMYMKRKKRSMRWVHQGEEGAEDFEDIDTKSV
ncbi:hypothetical protein SK128_002313 [Halocaridina rubra]|uniref:Uncharacterized protein n=1 Tax=Halocaridina rubra TaxID=373956 RepID=A0AAN8ZUF4_HALRR